MREEFTPNAFWGRHVLPFGEGVRQHCDLIATATVYCRGNVDQLETIMRGTPFELADDRFAICLSDYREVVMKRDDADLGLPGYLDCSIIIPARFGDVRGGYYWQEYESQWWSVSAGRELVGYPKMVGEIEFDRDETGVRGSASAVVGSRIDVELTYDDDVDAGRWEDLELEPHLTVRALPSLDGRREADFFDVIKGNTAGDHVLVSSQTARAAVNAAGGLGVIGPLEIEEVLGGELKTFKFQPTRGGLRYEVLRSYV